MNQVLQSSSAILPLFMAKFALQTSALDRMIRPFALIDIRMIDRYQVPASLFIYTLIFVGAAQVSLGRRFPGRAGRAISIGMGILLAVSLTAAEERLGFSLLRQLGPWALGIVCILCGIVVFRLLRFAGLPVGGSIAVAALSLFLVVLSVVPEFFIWLERTSPIFNAILLMALLLAVLAGFSSIRSVGTRDHVFESGLRKLRSTYLGIGRRKGMIDAEMKLIKGQIRPVSRKVVKGSEDILNDLQEVEEAVRRYGHIPRARQLILVQMGRILPKEHDLNRKLQGLRLMNEQVLRLDSSLISNESRERAKEMPSAEKRLFEKELSNEIGRVGLEKRLSELEEGFYRYDSEVHRFLNEAADHLKAGRVENASEAIRDTIACERTALELARKIGEIEQRLLALVRRDRKMTKALESV